MGRTNHIRVSDAEKEELNKARMSLYGTDEVPFGAVIDRLCREAGVSVDNDGPQMVRA
ncbi:hypothetical protein LC1Hm_1720 [Halomicrobium sp. LC1Hm]|nr:hypothetical protein LC1Hm_1720 [Halomicrobium sp. LC1Hm]